MLILPTSLCIPGLTGSVSLEPSQGQAYKKAELQSQRVSCSRSHCMLLSEDLGVFTVGRCPVEHPVHPGWCTSSSQPSLIFMELWDCQCWRRREIGFDLLVFNPHIRFCW
uniref:Uncharacterized protein n=1 Tax=Coturnix japonica TaxID=93934 RepID=A0A8C2SVX1_COTJA